MCNLLDVSTHNHNQLTLRLHSLCLAAKVFLKKYLIATVNAGAVTLTDARINIFDRSGRITIAHYFK